MLASWPQTKGSITRRLQRVSGPTIEPINFDLQRSMLKIGGVNANAYSVSAKIAAARAKVEKVLNRCLVQQQWDLFLDNEQYVGSFPVFETTQFADQNLRMPEITLPLPPVQQVLGVYVTDMEGNENLVDPEVYYVTKAKEPCRIRLAAGQFWPSARGGEAFRISFTAGYVTPFQVAEDGSGTILASNHGYGSGDLVTFTSLDGSLPQPLSWGNSYTVTNLTQAGFQLVDSNGNLLVVDRNWAGTGLIGEVPPPIVEAMAMISGLNQGGEVPSRIPGVSGRMSPLELPLDPMELLQEYRSIWL